MNTQPQNTPTAEQLHPQHSLLSPVNYKTPYPAKTAGGHKIFGISRTLLM